MYTLYFDNNIWLRPFQRNSGRSENEAVAVLKIIENCCDDYKIITSEYQENYFMGTQHSISLSNNDKEAFAKGLAVCQGITDQTKKKDPHCYHETKNFKNKVHLNDHEDRIHIVLAWRKKTDYFITADKELYQSKKKEIENELKQMYHPTAKKNTIEMKILDPITFVSVFINTK